jgi:hypothetical protein
MPITIDEAIENYREWIRRNGPDPATGEDTEDMEVARVVLNALEFYRDTPQDVGKHQCKARGDKEFVDYVGSYLDNVHKTIRNSVTGTHEYSRLSGELLALRAVSGKLGLIDNQDTPARDRDIKKSPEWSSDIRCPWCGGSVTAIKVFYTLWHCKCNGGKNFEVETLYRTHKIGKLPE